jgi:hypothetical protein
MKFHIVDQLNIVLGNQNKQDIFYLDVKTTFLSLGTFNRGIYNHLTTWIWKEKGRIKSM